jgi:DNA-binding GntR family transcriptional regulator
MAPTAKRTPGAKRTSRDTFKGEADGAMDTHTVGGFVPSRSSAAAAYNLMLSAIEEGRLPAGARLRESQLAAQFRISRTPVREVLRRLVTQGLATHVPHQGAVVTSISEDQITELYLVRESLEGVAARLAASNTTRLEIDLLYEMVENDQGLIEKPLELARSNRLFHARLCNAARNRYLTQTLGNLRLSLALLRGTTMSAPNRGAQAVEEHRAIIDFIAARRLDDAEEAARAHIRQAHRLRRAMIGAADMDDESLLGFRGNRQPA